MRRMAIVFASATAGLLSLAGASHAYQIDPLTRQPIASAPVMESRPPPPRCRAPP